MPTVVAQSIQVHGLRGALEDWVFPPPLRRGSVRGRGLTAPTWCCGTPGDRCILPKGVWESHHRQAISGPGSAGGHASPEQESESR